MQNKLEIIKQAFIDNGWEISKKRLTRFKVELNFRTFIYFNIEQNYFHAEFHKNSSRYAIIETDNFDELCQFIEHRTGFKIKRNLIE